MCFGPGVNFTNILRAAFTLVGPKSAKRHCQLGCLFAHTGSASVKAARKMLMKLSAHRRLHKNVYLLFLSSKEKSGTLYAIGMSRPMKEKRRYFRRN